MSGKVVAIVVTYNPDKRILEACLRQASKQTDKIIVVDNCSHNVSEIALLCKKYNCDLIKNAFNAGVPYALQRGINHAQKYHPDWILFLDQDCILFDGSVSKALSVYSSLPVSVRSRVGIIALGSKRSRERCSISETTYGVFSGTLIKNELIKNIKLRENFFLYQADVELYKKTTENGKINLLIDCKMMYHIIGTPLDIPFIFKLKRVIFNILKIIGLKNLGTIQLPKQPDSKVIYETSYKYYYIVRNGVILLKEDRKNIIEFLLEILSFGLAVAYVEGFTKMLHSLCLGLAHGILGLEGILEEKPLIKEGRTCNKT